MSRLGATMLRLHCDLRLRTVWHGLRNYVTILFDLSGILTMRRQCRPLGGEWEASVSHPEGRRRYEESHIRDAALVRRIFACGVRPAKQFKFRHAAGSTRRSNRTPFTADDGQWSRTFAA